MGRRREELSDFQRGTVVGCYKCKKSVREISALLDLPKSTVSTVILNWKRGGITTALPRSGRPHKLKEKDRQMLEKIAQESCLPSIKALTSEFQKVSGATVSCKTVRRELHEMGFRGRVSSYGKPRRKPHKGVNPMKKVWEQVQQEPSSNKEASCKVTDKEVCSGQSVSSTPIK